MISARRVAAWAGVLVIAAASPAAAQGSPINDLIAKGKRALNDFDFRTADTVWNQLLSQSLTRQQRIDVLQLLAATLYPDDAVEQKRDSASAVIRQVVGMGVRRMVVRDASWPGLDSLYRSVASQMTAAGAALETFDSVQDIEGLLPEYRAEEIAERVTIDCYSFAFEDLETAVRRSRPHATLPDALRRTCSRLLVESDPPNSQLTVGARNFGLVPERGQVRWVRPERSIEVAVSLGQLRAAEVVEFPQGRLLHARFFLPKDTVPWPATKTSDQIAQELQIFNTFRPSTPQPPAPAQPRTKSAFGTGLLWAVIGGGLGFGLGQFLPAFGCTVNEVVPTGQTWKIRGKRYAAGETANLGAGMPCVAAVSGGTGFGMFLIAAVRRSGKNGAARTRFAEETRAYPTVLKTWEDTERRAFAERNPDVRQALADQQIKLTQAQAENRDIMARNSNLPRPEVTVRDLNYVRGLGATSAPPAAGNATSDVDLRVPDAGAPNPDAVAIIVGNRDYRTQGVPKADFAIRDAVSMTGYLVEAFGFAENRVILDTNLTAGRMSELFGSAADAKQSRLADLVAGRGSDTDVFVFYSGHGGQEGRAAKKYLIPVDGNPRRLAATGYPLDVLYKNLTALRARSVTVAIDAGFGPLATSGVAIANQSFGGTVELEVGTVGGANTQVFLATTGDQPVRSRRDQGHGLFTYFFLKGLQGSADANGDMTITAGELETYVKANVRAYAADRMSGQQEPEVFTNNPRRPVVSLKP